MGDEVQIIKGYNEDLVVNFECCQLNLIFNLSFNADIQSMISKANQIIGIIKRAYNYLDRHFKNCMKTYAPTFRIRQNDLESDWSFRAHNDRCEKHAYQDMSADIM